MRFNARLAIAGVGAVVMEGIAAYAVLGFVTALLTGGRFLGPSILTVLAAILCAFGISRAVQHLDIDEADARRWAAGVSLFLFYTLLRLEYAHDFFWWDLSWLGDLLGGIGRAVVRRPDVFIGAFGLALVWVRGVLIGRESITFDNMLFPFSAGFVLTATAAVLSDAVGARASLKVMPILFGAFGLSVLAIAHMARVDLEPGRGFSRTWVFVLTATLVVLIGLTLIFALLDFGSVNALLRPVMRSLLWIIDAAILIIAFIFVYPTYWLLRGIIFVLAHIIPSGLLRQLDQRLSEQAQEEQRELNPLELPGVVLFIERLLVIVVIGVLAYLTLRWLLRRLVHLERTPDSLRESIYEEGGLADDFNAMLKALFGRFRRRVEEPPDLPEDILSIRRLYLQMLRRAEEDGLVRPPAATPHEFVPTLVEHFKSAAPEAISNAFAAARYGRHPPSRAELEQLRRAWQAVRSTR